MKSKAREKRAACTHCQGKGRVESVKLGSIRCPYCRAGGAKRVPARELGRLLSAADARRSDRQELARTVSLAEFKLPDVPATLVTTNRVLERWGEDGSGMPTENVDAFRVAKAPPLDPGTYTVVEKIVNDSPARQRRFAYAWYRSRNPAHLATTGRRGVSRRNLGRTRVDALKLFKAAFLASEYADLVALVRFIPD